MDLFTKLDEISREIRKLQIKVHELIEAEAVKPDPPFVGIYKTLLERVLIAFDFEGRERFERDIKAALAALDAGLPETGE